MSLKSKTRCCELLKAVTLYRLKNGGNAGKTKELFCNKTMARVEWKNGKHISFVTWWKKNYKKYVQNVIFGVNPIDS